MARSPTNHSSLHLFTHSLVVCGTLAMAGAVAWALWTTVSPTGANLRAPVYAELAKSGVRNPVTAVLLNFRGYDTLLEVAVLLLAVFGTWSLPPFSSLPLLREAVRSSVLRESVRVLTPMMIMMGGYLLWVGADAPGGAFQGAAVIAGAWVLLLLSERIASTWLPIRALRVTIVFGFGLFLVVAVSTILGDGHLLQYPQTWAKDLLLVIEAGLLFSIAAILVSLFTGRPVSCQQSQAPTSNVSSPTVTL